MVLLALLLLFVTCILAWLTMFYPVVGRGVAGLFATAWGYYGSRRRQFKPALLTAAVAWFLDGVYELGLDEAKVNIRADLILIALALSVVTGAAVQALQQLRRGQTRRTSSSQL